MSFVNPSATKLIKASVRNNRIAVAPSHHVQTSGLPSFSGPKRTWTMQVLRL